MHIAIDTRFYGLEHAGLGRYTLNLIQELTHIDADNQYSLFVWPKYENLELPSNFQTIVTDAAHHSIKEQLELASIINRSNFDLVHFPHFIVPILNVKTPFVVTIHDLIKHKHGNTEATTLPLPIYLMKYLAYKFDMWWAVHRSRHIITPTEAVKKDIVGWFHINPDKISATLEGFDHQLRVNLDTSAVDPKTILRKYSIRKPYILYVGNSYPYKNVKTLIQSLNFLPEDMSLVLVGSRNVFVEKMEHLAQELGMKNRVVFAGYVPDDDLGILYNQAIACVSATLEEGFGITPLEAMGAGCPAVISDIPVFREVCQEAALYFNPMEAHGLASRVQELFENQSLRDNLVQKGNDQVKKYSWNRMAQETLQIYKTIAQ